MNSSKSLGLKAFIQVIFKVGKQKKKKRRKASFGFSQGIMLIVYNTNLTVARWRCFKLLFHNSLQPKVMVHNRSTENAKSSNTLQFTSSYTPLPNMLPWMCKSPAKLLHQNTSHGPKYQRFKSKILCHNNHEETKIESTTRTFHQTIVVLDCQEFKLSKNNKLANRGERKRNLKCALERNKKARNRNKLHWHRNLNSKAIG